MALHRETPAEARREIDRLVDRYGGDELYALLEGDDMGLLDDLSDDEQESLRQITQLLDDQELIRRTGGPDALDAVDADPDLTPDFGDLQPQYVDDDTDDEPTDQQSTLGDPVDDTEPREFPTRPDEATKRAAKRKRQEQTGLGDVPPRADSEKATEQAREHQEREEADAERERPDDQKTLRESGSELPPTFDDFVDGDEDDDEDDEE